MNLDIIYNDNYKLNLQTDNHDFLLNVFISFHNINKVILYCKNQDDLYAWRDDVEEYDYDDNKDDILSLETIISNYYNIYSKIYKDNMLYSVSYSNTELKSFDINVINDFVSMNQLSTTSIEDAVTYSATFNRCFEFELVPKYN